MPVNRHSWNFATRCGLNSIKKGDMPTALQLLKNSGKIQIHCSSCTTLCFFVSLRFALRRHGRLHVAPHVNGSLLSFCCFYIIITNNIWAAFDNLDSPCKQQKIYTFIHSFIIFFTETTLTFTLISKLFRELCHS